MHRLLLALLRQVVVLPALVVVGLIRLLKWLIAPLALLFQMLLGMPLALNARQPRRARFRPIAEAELPDVAWIDLSDAAEALAAEDLISHGDFRCDDLIRNTTVWLRLLSQPHTGISALAACIMTPSRAHPLQSFVEFAAEFADGRILTLNNLTLAYGLPAPSYLARLQLKDVWDPRALYVLHRDLATALGQPIQRDKSPQAGGDPASWLAAGYQREIEALLVQGWLRPDPTASDQLRLTLKGALRGAWRQAWPLASLYLRAADRYAHRLLTNHDLQPVAFTGAAPGIVVARQLLPEPAPVATVRDGYALVAPLARRTDPTAVLEMVSIELERDASGQPLLLELRYSFGGYADAPQRRIRRLRSFDILLAPAAGALAVTAMERESEQAEDDEAWAELSAHSPLTPLPLAPWLHDLDQILPTALDALAAQAGGAPLTLDSASLYGNADGAPYWQVVAWQGAQDLPLHVRLDARSGALLSDP